MGQARGVRNPAGAEESDVEDIRFARVNDAHLGAGQGRRDEVPLDGVGVDTVVDFRQFAFRRPADLLLLLRLESLEFRDEIELELRRHPRGEFEGNVPVRECSPAAPSFGEDSDGIVFSNPACGAHGKGVVAGFRQKGVEIDPLHS